MIRRLIEADYLARSTAPSSSDVSVWLQESRTPAIIEALALSHPAEAASHARGAVREASRGRGVEAIAAELRHEEEEERAADAAYWQPLRRELELRRRRRAGERCQDDF